MFIIKGNHFIDCPFLVVKGYFVNNLFCRRQHNSIYYMHNTI